TRVLKESLIARNIILMSLYVNILDSITTIFCSIISTVSSIGIRNTADKISAISNPASRAVIGSG
ncbi:hypothetical protein L9F63_020512, partial [Diploptera punctata]